MIFVAEHLNLLFLLLLVGALGGFLSGLLGIGGGAVFTPALIFVFEALGFNSGVGIHTAIGTSLVIVSLTIAASALHHNKMGAVDATIFRRQAPFLVAGAVLGSIFADGAEGATLKKVLAVVLLIIAFRMAFAGKEHTGRKHAVPMPARYAFSLFVGWLSAVVGGGGGALNVPFMIYAGTPVRQAVATAAALGPFITVPAAIGYIIAGFDAAAPVPFSFGYINIAAVLVILPLSLFLSPIGVKFSHKAPQDILAKTFAVVLALVSVVMIVN